MGSDAYLFLIYFLLTGCFGGFLFAALLEAETGFQSTAKNIKITVTNKDRLNSFFWGFGCIFVANSIAFLISWVAK